MNKLTIYCSGEHLNIDEGTLHQKSKYSEEERKYEL
jgi:hypothetical protein